MRRRIANREIRFGGQAWLIVVFLARISRITLFWFFGVGGGLMRKGTKRLRDRTPKKSPQRHRGHGEKRKKLCVLCVSVVK